jgi:hypothetical protein
MGYHGLAGVEEATLVKRLTVHGLRLQNFLLFYPMAEQAGVACLSALGSDRRKLLEVKTQPLGFP